MAGDDIRNLWKLHLIDEAIYEIRARAGALDPGREVIAQIKAATELFDSASSESNSLSGELADLELKQKSIDEKIAKFNKELFGGSVVNPREVENIQKEIDMLKRQRTDMDSRILELWELVPPAKEKADTMKTQIDKLKADLAAHQKKVMAAKGQLEEAFKQKNLERAPAVQKVEPNLLTKYEAVRKKYGIGMAQITKQGSCGNCGLSLATKVVEFTKEGRLQSCEQCFRILYYTEGLI